MKDTKGLPINIFFLKNQKGELELSFNGGCISKKNIISAKKILRNFLRQHTEEDIEKYNEEVLKRCEEDLNEDIENSQSKSNIPKDGYIYVIKSGNHYKIGKAKTPRNRLKKYITENPNKISLLLCEKVYDYDEVEINLHQKFVHKKHSREWFNLEKGDIYKIKKILKTCQSQSL